MIDEAMAKFCAERPASEVERIFSGAKVPASLVYSYTDMKDNPHFQARETFTTYPSARYETDVIAPNVQPVLKNEPGLVWRSGVDSGFDNEDILRDFGFDESRRRHRLSRGQLPAAHPSLESALRKTRR